MLGSLILYLKGMRTTMFQLSGFYCRVPRCKVWGENEAAKAPELVACVSGFGLM